MENSTSRDLLKTDNLTSHELARRIREDVDKNPEWQEKLRKIDNKGKAISHKNLKARRLEVNLISSAKNFFKKKNKR